jgi:replicative DNA helicase
MTDEKYFIGQILWDSSIYHKTAVAADDFLGRQEAIIFEAMATVEVIDELSLHKATGIPLMKLIEYKASNVVASSWQSVQKRIIEESRKRRIKRAAEDIYRGNMTADAMIDLFAEATQSVKRNASFKLEKLPDCIMLAISDIEKRATSKGIQGISTGFRKLDYMFGGLQKGKLYLIGARPSQGKSTLLMNIAVNMKKPLLFVTAESSKEELSKRAISYKGRVNNSGINNGDLNEKELKGIRDASSDLYNRDRFIIYDESNASINRVVSMANDAVKYHGIQAVFVDYLQIIKHTNDRIPRHEQVAEVSKLLKQLARDLQVPVVVASQLRRDAEGKKPQLSDFSDSTQIERDADVAMAIFNVPDGSGNVKVGSHTYVCVLKNRDGALGDIAFDGQMQYYYFQESLGERHERNRETTESAN